MRGHIRSRYKGSYAIYIELERDPVTKKVHDSYMAYKAKYDDWADKSELIYHTKIRKG